MPLLVPMRCVVLVKHQHRGVGDVVYNAGFGLFSKRSSSTLLLYVYVYSMEEMFPHSFNEAQDAGVHVTLCYVNSSTTAFHVRTLAPTTAASCLCMAWPPAHRPACPPHCLPAALQDADDDEESGAGAVHQEEWMVRVAVLLRAHPATSFNQLAEQLTAKQQALAVAASTSADPSELLEQLYWLARMAAHALADTGVGEVPLPPEAVLLAVGDGSLTTPAAAAGQPQPQQQQQQQQAAAVERLSRALLELTALCLQQAAAAVVSSRLMEGAVWGAARWADTYLFPDEEPLPEALEAAFGDQAGAHILDMLLHVAQHCLAAFPGEAELHRQVRRAGDCWLDL
jgi:hypothetical protein